MQDSDTAELKRAWKELKNEIKNEVSGESLVNEDGNIEGWYDSEGNVYTKHFKKVK